MKSFLFRLSLVAAVTLGVIAFGSSARAQEPNSQEPAATTPPQQQTPAPSDASPQDQDRTPSATPQQQPQEPAATPQQNEPQMPAAGTDAQTQEAKAFTGRIMRENGKVVLKDPITKNSYQIDDTSKVKPYMGKQVKVTGKLDMNSNLIHIESVEPVR